MECWNNGEIKKIEAKLKFEEGSEKVVFTKMQSFFDNDLRSTAFSQKKYIFPPIYFYKNT
jgi:hypothetical protein